MEIKQLTDADRNRIKVIAHFMPSWHNEQIPYKYGDNYMLLVVFVIVIEAVIQETCKLADDTISPSHLTFAELRFTIDDLNYIVWYTSNIYSSH